MNISHGRKHFIKQNRHVILVLFFIILGVVSRSLPHLYNFSPIISIAIFSGFLYGAKRAFLLPIIIMFIGDLFIGFYQIPLMSFVYGSIALCTILGNYLKTHKRWIKVFGISLAGSTLFFLMTNFAVWWLTPWYEKTLFGLMASYIAGLPFYRNALIGDLFYSIIFFGLYAVIIESRSSQRAVAITHFNQKHEQSSVCLSK